MNTNQNGTDEHSTHENPAAQRAEAGATAWRDAARLQLSAAPDHADFYALAGEMVATLHALDDLGRVLRGQVAGYVQAQRLRNRTVYDDTRTVDPAERLEVAVVQLDEVTSATVTATNWVTLSWSAIGHIGVEDVAP